MNGNINKVREILAAPNLFDGYDVCLCKTTGEIIELERIMDVVVNDKLLCVISPYNASYFKLQDIAEWHVSIRKKENDDV